jgi:hypothetical protein
MFTWDKKYNFTLMTNVCMYVGKLQVSVWIPLQRYPKRWAISRNVSEVLRCVQVISDKCKQIANSSFCRKGSLPQ